MPYIGAGIQRFNTADSLTVNGDAEITGTVNPSGDTASGDAAAVGFTSTEGLILTGQGSTSDVVIKNDADTTVCFVPTGTDDLKFNDTARIIMGAGDDLQIIHDGSNSIVSDNGTGNLVLRSDAAAVEIDFNTDETAALFNHNGSVELYHDNSKKFETTSSGVDVTGTAVTDGLTSSAALDVTTSTHANASVFKSTGNTQLFLQDTDASSNDQFWGLQVSGGDFNILTCDDDRASNFITPVSVDSSANTTLKCTAGDSNQALSAWHPTSTSSRTIARFQSNVGGTQATQAVIRCNGDTGIGTTTTSFRLNVVSGRSDYVASFDRNVNIDGNFRNMIKFARGGTAVGEILCSNSATQYGTSSDHRLKENVEGMTGAIARVKQLSPKRFSWIVDDLDAPNFDGFLAHEAQAVVPEAVSGTHNQVATWTQQEIDDEDAPDGTSAGDNKLDDDGNTIPVMQSIDHSMMVPLLTGALQEAITKIETLETEMTALKARVTALEDA